MANIFNYLILLVQVASFTLSFFLIIIIIKRSDKQNFSNRILLLFLVIKNYGLFLFIVLKTGLLNDFWLLYRTGLPTSLFFPALGYLYLKSVVHDEEKLKKADLIHLGPLLIGIIQYLPYYLSDVAFKKQTVAKLGKLSEEFVLKIGVLPESEFTLIRGLVFLIYAVLILAFVFRKILAKKQVVNKRQTLDLQVIKWIKTFGISFSISCLMVFGYFYLEIFTNFEEDTFLLQILAVGVALFFNGAMIYYSSYLILNPETLIGLYKRPNTFIKKNNSIIRDNDFSEIIHKIEKELKDNLIYTQPDINIEKLAQKINQPTRLTSYVINNYFAMNFNQLINNHRIEESTKKLENGYLKEYTIDALWSEIGFSNRTSFYKKFKETTGMTPVEYVKIKQPNKN